MRLKATLSEIKMATFHGIEIRLYIHEQNVGGQEFSREDICKAVFLSEVILEVPNA